MSIVTPWPMNPELDLVLQRDIDVPPALVWKAWTEPEHLKVWFCPRPWQVTSCEMEVRPGGIFHTVMQSPDGQTLPSSPGCYLEVTPLERLVWTDCLGPDYRPAASGFLTAAILLETLGEGTRYTAIAMHKDPEGRQQHEDMGFMSGWNTALDQLVEHVKGLP